MGRPRVNGSSGFSRAAIAWTVLWLGAWAGLFVVMHVPVPRGVAPPFDYFDLVVHAVAYFTLGLLGTRSALSRGATISARWTIRWLMIYVAYAAADELLQGPVHRTPSMADWAADVLGAAAALGIAYVNRPIAADADEPPPPRA